MGLRIKILSQNLNDDEHLNCVPICWSNHFCKNFCFWSLTWRKSAKWKIEVKHLKTYFPLRYFPTVFNHMLSVAEKDLSLHCIEFCDYNWCIFTHNNDLIDSIFALSPALIPAINQNILLLQIKSLSPPITDGVIHHKSKSKIFAAQMSKDWNENSLYLWWLGILER